MGEHTSLLKLLHQKGVLQKIPDEGVFVDRKEGPLYILAELNLLDEKNAIDVLCQHFRLPYLNLEAPEAQDLINPDDFRGTPGIVPICWNNHIAPLYEDNDSFVVASSNPFLRDVFRSLEFALSKPVKVVLSEESKIYKVLSINFPEGLEPDAELEDESLVDVIASANKEEKSDDMSAPAIIRFANKIMVDAVRLGASDIHIEPGAKNMLVRFRIDGVLEDIIAVPKKLQGNVVARLKVLAKMDVADKRRPQDGRIRAVIGKRDVDLRVSSVPTSYGEKLVMRVSSGDKISKDLASLKMPKLIEDRFRQALHKKAKMVLVTGPTGSGKTTTLFVALNYLADGTTNITTIEDPIEIRFPGLNQVQVNEQAGVSFASVLRSLLRQDPDVIMVGEIRDEETLKITLHAAQTGHLVLSTVHTNDAPSALVRIQNLGADPEVCANALIGILAQRLVRAICVHCKGPLDDQDIFNYRQYISRYKIDPRKLKKGKGCDYCGYSGYKGRQGVHSYLHIDENIAELIEAQAPQDEIIRVAKENGFQDLEEVAIDLALSGVTTMEEIKGYLGDKKKEDPKEVVTLEEKPKEIEVPIVTNIIETSFESLTKPMKAKPSKPVILIIDDNASVRKMLSTMLSKEHVEIVQAENGVQGLNLLYEKLPSVILCDISMPEMNGKEFLKRLKKNKQFRDVPILMLTIDDQIENEVEFLDLGATSFLSKRLPPAVMLSRVKSVLSNI
jgi:type II secretory ATPase GspE/PulE/Tfp pilus assembly ATPase PilB-like protein